MANQNDPLEVVPAVGMAGLYSLKAPYANLLRPQIEYTCTAVVNLQGAIADGQDPHTDVYKANGDTDENYEADLALNRCLITLQSGMGDMVVAPASAMNGLPIADGVRYMSSVLGISLSALPEDFDLTIIKQEISDLIFDKIGVRSTVYGSTVGGTMILPHTQHAAIEAAREANVTINVSDRAQVVKLQNEKTELQARLTRLQAYIVQHLPPETP